MKPYGKSRYHSWSYRRKTLRWLNSRNIRGDLDEADINKSAARHEARDEIRDEESLYLNNRQGDEDQMCDCEECNFWWGQRRDVMPVECGRMLEKLEADSLGFSRHGMGTLFEPFATLQDITPTRVVTKAEGDEIQTKINNCGKFVEFCIEDLIG